MIMHRRGFLTFLGTGLIAAPAIVRAASLMPIRGIIMPIVAGDEWFVEWRDWEEKGIFDHAVADLDLDASLMKQMKFAARRGPNFLMSDVVAHKELPGYPDWETPEMRRAILKANSNAPVG